MRSSRRILLALCMSPLLAPAAHAQDGANAAFIEEGRQLLAQHRCNGACHQSHSDDNDPLSLYTRDDRLAVDRAGIDRYVGLCVASIGAMIFPEELPKISSALNADFYKFK